MRHMILLFGGNTNLVLALGGAKVDELECNVADIPVDDSNLVIKVSYLPNPNVQILINGLQY